jgi:FkbM family methyltransferase
MGRLILGLGSHRSLHTLVALLHVVTIADVVLGRFPLRRRLKRAGYVYRVTSFDQLSLESGLFKREEYAPAINGHSVATFIDLGCNAGWFTLWLTDRNADLRMRGLLIDAHPRMVAEAIWHVKQNRLTNCFVVHGAVGLPPGQASTTFHLHPSTSASSVLPYQPGRQLPAKGKIIDVNVPAISVSSEWEARFGGSSVDLLKVDIEGKELDFVVNEAAFLQQRVKRIVVEWHKWCVPLEKLAAHLDSIGFELGKIFDETDLVGLAVFQNTREVG